MSALDRISNFIAEKIAEGEHVSPSLMSHLVKIRAVEQLDAGDKILVGHFKDTGVAVFHTGGQNVCIVDDTEGATQRVHERHFPVSKLYLRRLLLGTHQALLGDRDDVCEYSDPKFSVEG